MFYKGRSAVVKLRFSSAHTVLRCCLPVLLFLYPAFVSAQADYCDPSLEIFGTHPLGYRMRGERCEGIYIKEVAGSILRIASFTGYFEDYDLNASKALTIDWAIPADTGIHIRAHSLKRKLYYRMDTVGPPAKTSYEWPTDVLAALNIPKKDLGVTGWFRYSLGETIQRVYLPLSVTQKQMPLTSGSYRLVLIPGRELMEVFVSLANVGADGQPDVFILEGEPLNYGYYPAEREITIPISHLKEKGIYFTEIGATLRGGGAATVELWFYHLGK
jgi:hypothetical protein